MATHSSTLDWILPWTEEPGRLQSMTSLSVGHNWVTSLSLFTFMHWRRKWQPTPVFLPEESQGWGAWWAAICGVTQSWTWLKHAAAETTSLKRLPWARHKCQVFYIHELALYLKLSHGTCSSVIPILWMGKLRLDESNCLAQAYSFELRPLGRVCDSASTQCCESVV